MWSQGYDPLGNAVLSTLLAATPIVILLGTLAWLKWKAHKAALLALATALVIAILVFGMPASMAVSAAVYGAAFGFLPIGYIVLNALYLYSLCNESGLFKTLRESITAVTPDRRLQVLLVGLRLRGLHGRRRRPRRADRGGGRHADRARLPAARRLGAGTGREHDPRSIRGSGDPDRPRFRPSRNSTS